MRLPDSEPDALRKRVADALYEAGMVFEAEEIRECGKWWTVYLCPSDGEREYAIVKPCKKRLCPWCSRQRQKKAYALYHEPLAAVKEPKMLVLTVRNVKLGDLQWSLKKLGEHLSTFWKKVLKKRVKGAVVAIEVTYNAEEKTWHPHAHLLIDGPYLPQAWVVNEWRNITKGWGEIVWIERCRAGWEKELLKYVTKQVAFLGEPRALREFVYAAKRYRFLRCWGSFYGLDKKLEDDEWERLCPKCKQAMILLDRNVSIESLLRDGGGMFYPGCDLYDESRGSPPNEVIYEPIKAEDYTSPTRRGGFTWQPSLLDTPGAEDKPHDLR